MLCVEDILDALGWAEQAGGLPGLIARSAANLAAVESWVASSSWAGFLAEDEAIRSPTSICLSIVDPVFRARSEEHTSELQSLMRNSYAVFCLEKTDDL